MSAIPAFPGMENICLELESYDEYHMLRQNQISAALGSIPEPFPACISIAAPNQAIIPSNYIGPRLNYPYSYHDLYAILVHLQNGPCTPIAAEYVRSIVKLAHAHLAPRNSQALLHANIPEKMIVIGDTHGHLKDVLWILHQFGYPNQNLGYIFNGDLVDRGKHGLEIFLIAILMMLLSPTNCFINRGNHEDPIVNSSGSCGGFSQELITKYGQREGTEIWQLFVDLYQHLPLVTVFNNSVAVLHGGLSGVNDSLGILSRLRNTTDVPSHAINEETCVFVRTLWSDPRDEPGINPSTRGASMVTWGPDITWQFLEQSQLSLLIRSHEIPPNKSGVHEYPAHDNRVITVFSASYYCDVQKNRGGVLILSDNCNSYVKAEYFAPTLQELQEWPVRVVDPQIANIQITVPNSVPGIPVYNEPQPMPLMQMAPQMHMGQVPMPLEQPMMQMIPQMHQMHGHQEGPGLLSRLANAFIDVGARSVKSRGLCKKRGSSAGPTVKLVNTRQQQQGVHKTVIRKLIPHQTNTPSMSNEYFTNKVGSVLPKCNMCRKSLDLTPANHLVPVNMDKDEVIAHSRAPIVEKVATASHERSHSQPIIKSEVEAKRTANRYSILPGSRESIIRAGNKNARHSCRVSLSYSRPNDENYCDFVLNRIKLLICERKPELQQAFKTLSPNSRYIKASAWANVMKEIYGNFPWIQIGIQLSVFSISNELVDYNSFLNRFIVTFSGTYGGQMWLSDVLALVQARLMASHMDMKSLLEFIDPNSEGKLNNKQLTHLLRALKVDMTSSQVTALMRVLGEGNESVPITKLLQCFSGIARVDKRHLSARENLILSVLASAIWQDAEKRVVDRRKRLLSGTMDSSELTALRDTCRSSLSFLPDDITEDWTPLGFTVQSSENERRNRSISEVFTDVISPAWNLVQSSAIANFFDINSAESAEHQTLEEKFPSPRVKINIDDSSDTGSSHFSDEFSDMSEKVLSGPECALYCTFSGMDKNNDGYLDDEEILTSFKAYIDNALLALAGRGEEAPFEDVTVEEIRKISKLLNQSGNSKVSFLEFMSLFHPYSSESSSADFSAAITEPLCVCMVQNKQALIVHLLSVTRNTPGMVSPKDLCETLQMLGKALKDGSGLTAEQAYMLCENAGGTSRDCPRFNEPIIDYNAFLNSFQLLDLSMRRGSC